MWFTNVYCSYFTNVDMIHKKKDYPNQDSPKYLYKNYDK